MEDYLVYILLGLRGQGLGRPMFFSAYAPPVSREGGRRKRNSEYETASFWAEVVILQFGQ
jgi:hypothetical protein